MTLVEEQPGGWCLLLARPGAAAVEARVSPGAVAELCAAAEALPARAPQVLSRRAAADWSEAEQGFGRKLAEMLGGQPELWAALWRQLGAAWERDEVAVLCVCSSGAGARALPWELLAESATGAVLAATRPFVAARLVPGPPLPALGALRLRLVLWTPDPEDPVVGQVVAERLRSAAAAGLPAVVVRPPTFDLEPPPPGTADLLCIVAHGEAGERAVSLLLPTGPVPPQDPGAALSLALRSAQLVVLEVCAADAPVGELPESLAGRLVLAGARAVLAPRRPWLVRSFDALFAGLLPPLLRGETLAAALRSGLASVSAAGLAHPGARPWTLRLSVGAAEELGSRLATLPWPSELPAPDGEAAALIALAAKQSRAGGHGFLGLEHLALAQLEIEHGGPLTARLRPAIWGQREALRTRLSALCRAQGAPGLDLTPRLRALAKGLPAPFSLDDLWAAIADERFSPLVGLAPVDAARTQRTRSALSAAAPQIAGVSGPASIDAPELLELVGGPEDGRRVALAPGQTLGRWVDGACGGDIGLYEGCAVTDERLSRRALTWKGPGQAEIHQRGARLLRWGRVERVPPSLRVLVDGDVWMLTEATWLGAVAGNFQDPDA